MFVLFLQTLEHQATRIFDGLNNFHTKTPYLVLCHPSAICQLRPWNPNEQFFVNECDFPRKQRRVNVNQTLREVWEVAIYQLRALRNLTFWTCDLVTCALIHRNGFEDWRKDFLDERFLSHASWKTKNNFVQLDNMVTSGDKSTDVQRQLTVKEKITPTARGLCAGEETNL